MQLLTVLSLLLSLSVAKASTCSAQMNETGGAAISPPMASDANSEAVPLDEVSLLQAQVLLRSTEATVEQMSEGFVQEDEVEDDEGAGKTAQESVGCLYGYTVMQRNTNACTHGRQAIQDGATCEYAANSQKYEWKGVLKMPSPRHPKGCIVSRWNNRKLVYFNEHASGKSNANSAPICCALCGTGYTDMNYNTNACTHGYRAIQDAATCEMAANSQKYPWKWVFWSPMYDFPKGCLVWQAGNEKNVYFNNHKSGKSNPRMAPICCTAR